MAAPSGKDENKDIQDLVLGAPEAGTSSSKQKNLGKVIKPPFLLVYLMSTLNDMPSWSTAALTRRGNKLAPVNNTTKLSRLKFQLATLLETTSWSLVSLICFDQTSKFLNLIQRSAGSRALLAKLSHSTQRATFTWRAPLLFVAPLRRYEANSAFFVSLNYPPSIFFLHPKFSCFTTKYPDALVFCWATTSFWSQGLASTTRTGHLYVLLIL